MDLNGKTALVTGAATGIGNAIAKGLLTAGAHVIGVDVSDPGGEADGIERLQYDLSNPADVVRCFAGINERSGGVDILVNNAALSSEITPKPFTEISPEEWMRVMTVNTIMPFLCSRAVVPHMREKQWGRIVNLTSAAIFLGTPNNLHYNASKGAIAVMTRCLAKEIGSDGINVNAIAPGLTATEGLRNNPAYTEEMFTAVANSRAIPREETPDDLVATCLFLVSGGADFMTGQILTVDGGTAFN